jgi:hypothetical protein
MGIKLAKQYKVRYAYLDERWVDVENTNHVRLLRDWCEISWWFRRAVPSERIARFILGLQMVTYELTDAYFDIEGRGRVYIAKLTSNTNRDDLKLLLGTELNGKTIVGVESFALHHLRKGFHIGLLVAYD